MENYSQISTEIELKMINNDLKSLFDGILDDIFYTKESITNNPDKININGIHLIISDTLSDENHFKKSKIFGKANLIFVKNCVQLKGALCGFHTLFNLENFIKFYIEFNNYQQDMLEDNLKKDLIIKKMLYYLNKMKNRSKFWAFYKKTKDYIVKEFPREADNLNKMGPLERYQLKHVLDHSEKFQLTKNKHFKMDICNFFLSFGIINSLTRPDIVLLQKKLEDFKKLDTDIPSLMVVILGLTNHWSVLIMEKKGNYFNFFYIDSYEDNIPILENMEEIYDLVNKKIIENEKYKRHTTEFGKKCYIQYLKDLYMTLNIFYDIIYSNFSLIRFYLENILSHFTKSFSNYISFNNEQKIINLTFLCQDKYFDELFEIIINLNNWIKIDYHPKVIESEIITTLKIFEYKSKNFEIDSILLIKLKNIVLFTSKIKQFFKEFCQFYPEVILDDDKHVIERFFTVIEEIKSMI